jgi:hypothetical protein
MSIRVDDRIPDEVLLLMETSVDEWVDAWSDEMLVFRAAADGYRSHLGTASEPAYRQALATTYLELVAPSRERLLDRPRREAIERCAQGFPYVEAV